MIVCVNCGQMNETAASRCLRCGASIFELPSYLNPSDARPVSPPPPAPTDPPTYIQPPTYMPAQPASPFPPPVAPPVPFVFVPVAGQGGIVCPYCRTNLPPRFRSQISTGGWIMLVVSLVFCWPLFWIGLLMREEYCTCRVCGRRLT
ncbi:MAG: LITAF-like zinc ribbon domain-containing protein [Chloracidobacterium sp.]